jgi:hypothetical protein
MAVDAHEQKVIDVVDRVGWMVMKVGPNKGDLFPCWFAYTVGLSVTQQWPELICFGPRLEVTAQLVNNAVLEMKRKALTPTPGLELTEVMEGYPVRLEEFALKFFREYLGWAMWFAHYRGVEAKSFHCMQMVCPDKDGRFPSDPLCDENIRQIQTPRTMAH